MTPAALDLLCDDLEHDVLTKHVVVQAFLQTLKIFLVVRFLKKKLVRLCTRGLNHLFRRIVSSQFYGEYLILTNALFYLIINIQN